MTESVRLDRNTSTRKNLRLQTSLLLSVPSNTGVIRFIAASSLLLLLSAVDFGSVGGTVAAFVVTSSTTSSSTSHSSSSSLLKRRTIVASAEDPARSRQNRRPAVQHQDKDNGGDSYCSASSGSSLQSSFGGDVGSTATTAMAPMWFQHSITVTAPSRGCHLITRDIMKAISGDLSKINIGMCNLFVQHTSASLTINENADPDVRRDMEVAMNKIVPAQWNRDGTFLHTMEGDDDMPGHIKSSLMGVSLNIPIQNGRLALGTWQGIYLNEHRDQGGWGGGHSRNIVITLQGQGK